MPLSLYRVGADSLSYCSIVAKESVEVAEELIQLNVVHGLMVAVGNVEHMPSQRHGSISLKVSVMVCSGGQCTTESLPWPLEQKGSLHCGLFFFFLSTAQSYSQRQEWHFLQALAVLPVPYANHQKEGAEKPALALTPLLYAAACPE